MSLINVMKNLDFTEYEAKAYIALLKNSPLTGYAVAKNSGVPRSKIYEVLDALCSRGDIIVSDGKTPLYRPISVNDLVASRRNKINESLNVLEEELKQVEVKVNDDNIWNIKGRDNIIRQVRNSIESAKSRILIELWSEDFIDIDAELREAANRGVKIIIISYGEISANYATVYLHDMSEEITEEYGGRWIVFSVDDTQVIAGTVSFDEESRVAWTNHSGLVMPITEVMIHDLYIAEILNKHRDTLEKSFGPDLIELRKKFSIDGDLEKHYIKSIK